MRAVELDELTEAMVLDEDILTRTGKVVVGAGRELNPALIERLRNVSRGIVEPIRVRAAV